MPAVLTVDVDAVDGAAGRASEDVADEILGLREARRAVKAVPTLDWRLVCVGVGADGLIEVDVGR